MTLQPVLINGSWREAVDPVGSFHAVDPATKTPLADEYPISSLKDVDAALEAAQVALDALRAADSAQIARFLEIYADQIDQAADALVEMAHLESGLPAEPRLRNTELPRTSNQLRQAATAAREKSWCRATIDTKNNIRSKLAPLDGAVVVFGPNNFPFAFNSAAGGDFASAIAAGNPVIAKSNPGHPGTTQLLADAALQAAHMAGMPGAILQLIYHLNPDTGFALVSHPLTGATAFTGSRTAGLKLKEAADRAGRPIYLELSSVNPVFMLPGALAERGSDLAAEYAGSVLLGGGQFCTNSGLVFLIEGEPTAAFVRAVGERLSTRPPAVLLGENVPRHLDSSLAQLRQAGAQLVVGGKTAEGKGYCYENSLLRVSGDVFLRDPDRLQTEAFGPAALFVIASDQDQLLSAARHLQGNLTGAIYSATSGADDALYDRLAPTLRAKVGRLLNDKMPTGVTVSPAMNHGGPYPSTGHPGFTAVGIPASMLRFAALQCYDNVRPHRLPPELQNPNPTGSMWRFIDGEWTQRNL